MATVPKRDLTVIYITANKIDDYFAENVREQLDFAKGDLPLISVSKKPLDFGHNICVGQTPRSTANIYRQALIGAKVAKTPYIAIAEDDVLYSPEHFKYRPSPKTWAYNMNSWNVYTWQDPPCFTQKTAGRKNLNGLICEKQLFIDHIEERFRLWPDEKIDPNIFGEPGKYDKQLGTTPYPTESFFINPPNIVFSHKEEISFEGLGERKALGQIRAAGIPVWGTIDGVMCLYKEDYR